MATRSATSGRGLIRSAGAWVAAASVLCATAALGGITDAPAAADECGNQPCTWNFRQVSVPAAQVPGAYGRGTTVAVVDSWVDYAHQDFAGRVAGHAYCVDGGGRCRENTRAPDPCVHGTHVAGTVASTRYGVAPQARVLAVQVLTYDPASGSCSGTAEDVAAGIRYAARAGADVINLSLGGMVPGLFQSAPVTDAVRDAAASGAVLVFAAGNSTVPLSDDYGSDALLVAATGPDGGIASYSSRGGSIDLAAPGGDDGAAGLRSCQESTCILSTLPNNAYGLREGTSMAAPHVSGTAALLVAQDRRRGRADVITTLRSTARPLSGVRHGLLDAGAALRQRAEAPPVAGPTRPRPSAPTTTAAEPGPFRLPTRSTRPAAPYRPLPTNGVPGRPSQVPQADRTDEFVAVDPGSPGSPADPGASAAERLPLPAIVAIGALLAVVAVGAVRAVSNSSARR